VKTIKHKPKGRRLKRKVSSEEEFDLEDIEEDTEMRNALADEVSEL